MKKRKNPNGANQWVVDPRQTLFLENYLNPESETFSNALQSALKAGYSQEFSESITSQMPKWLAESLGELAMLSKAERNLDYYLDLDTENVGVTKKGDTFTFNDARLENIKADISKFIAERIGKRKYGKDEKPQGNIFNQFNFFSKEQMNRVAAEYLKLKDAD